MKKRKVFIILINYNSYVYTKDCLLSLEQIDYDNYEIIVVDNSSADDSFRRLQADFGYSSHIVFLEAGSNLGFAGGNNLGIRYALANEGDLFLMLNNDTEAEPDFLSELVKEYKDNCIYTPKICYDSDRKSVWYAGGTFDKKRCVVKNKNMDHKAEVNFASGCCMLFSRQVIERVGFLQEDFFMYYEDVEFSLRALSKGIRIVYIPSSVIYHKVGKSSGGETSAFSIYYTNRNRFYLIQEYHLGIVCIVYTFFTRMLRVLTAGIRKSNDRIIIEAYRDFRNHKKGRKETL